MKTDVWADGYGVWHASVPISGSRHKDAMLARKLIMAELLEREWRGTVPHFSVTREQVTNHGKVKYREVTR